MNGFIQSFLNIIGVEIVEVPENETAAKSNETDMQMLKMKLFIDSRTAALLYIAAALIHYVCEFLDKTYVAAPPVYDSFMAIFMIFPILALSLRSRESYFVFALTTVLWDIFLVYLMSFNLHNVLFINYLANGAILAVAVLSVENNCIVSKVWYIPALLKTIQMLCCFCGGDLEEIALLMSPIAVFGSITGLMIGILTAFYSCMWLKEEALYAACNMTCKQE